MSQVPLKRQFNSPYPSGSLIFSGSSFRDNFQALYAGDFEPMRPMAHDTPNMSVMVLGTDSDNYQRGVYYGNNSQRIPLSSGDSPTMIKPSSNPRIDVVYASPTGAILIASGTEAGSPTIPDISTSGDRFPICAIYHKTTSQKIVNYVDRNAFTGDSYILADLRPIYSVPRSGLSDSAQRQINTNTRNIMLNRLLIMQNHSLNWGKFIDGWADDFQTPSGIIPSYFMSGDLVSVGDKLRYSRNYSWLGSPTFGVVKDIGVTDFGTGADGDLTVNSNQNYAGYSYKVSSMSVNQMVCTADPVSASIGHEVMLIHIQGNATDTGSPPTGAVQAGKYEFLKITSVNHSTNTITFSSNIVNTTMDTGGIVQIVQVKNYNNVTINVGNTLNDTDPSGDARGGFVVFRVLGTFACNGNISTQGGGFAPGSGGANGGDGGDSWAGLGGDGGVAGDGSNGDGGGGGAGTGLNQSGGYGVSGGGGGNSGTGSQGASYNGGAGGGGTGAAITCGGGGGGYGSAGVNGTDSVTETGGTGGGTYGSADLSKIYFGSGGGEGGHRLTGSAGRGGDGGGIIYICANSISLGASSSINARGENGTAGSGSNASGGGAGSGGSVFLKGKTVSIGTNKIDASGGTGGGAGTIGTAGGAGGAGRIAIYYETSLSGTSTPSANTYQVLLGAIGGTGLDGKGIVLAGPAGFDFQATKATVIAVSRSGEGLTCEISRNSGTTWNSVPLSSDFYDGTYYYRSGINTGLIGSYTTGTGDYAVTFVIPSGNSSTLEAYGVSLA